MIKNIIITFDGILFPDSLYKKFASDEEKVKKLDEILDNIYQKNKELIAHKNFVKEIFKQELTLLAKSDFNEAEIKDIFDSITIIDERILRFLNIINKHSNLYGLVNKLAAATFLRIYFFNLSLIFKDYLVLEDIGFLREDSPDIDPYSSLVVDISQSVLSKAKDVGFNIYFYDKLEYLIEYLKESTGLEIFSKIKFEYL